MQNLNECYIITRQSRDNTWVWRSLVARLNGVQEAGSSNLLTQTTQEHRDMSHGVPRFVGGEKTMTTRDAHVRSPRLSPVSFAVDAPLRSVGFPTFRLTPPQFSRPFAIPSLRSLQIFSPRPERRGLNSSATLFVNKNRAPFSGDAGRCADRAQSPMRTLLLHYLEIVSSTMREYLTGRLRGRWTWRRRWSGLRRNPS